MNLTLTLVVAAYIAASFLVALWLRRRVRSQDDYFLAGRQMGTVLTATMLLAINFGGAFVIGTSQDAYSVGFAAISFALGICVGFLLLALFIARRMRSGGYVTVPEFLERRFSSGSVRLFATVLSILALTGILAGQVGAAASAISALGLPYEVSAIIGVLLFVAFTVVAGMWGVAITDFIQFCVIVVGLLLVMFISVDMAGGLGALAVPFTVEGNTAPFSPLNQGWSFFLGAALPVVVHKMVGQDVMQRVFAAKTGTVAVRGAAIAGVLTAAFAVVPALAGMSARVILPDLDPKVGVVPALMNEVLPSWAAGLLIAAIISAVLSTADALLLAAVSNISSDVLPRVAWWNRENTNRLLISRGITILLGALALVFALAVPNIITILTMAFTMYGSAVFVSFIFGHFTRVGGKKAAISSMAGGAGAALLGLTKLVVVPGVPAIVPALGVSLLIYLVVAVAFEQNAVKVDSIDEARVHGA